MGRHRKSRRTGWVGGGGIVTDEEINLLTRVLKNWGLTGTHTAQNVSFQDPGYVLSANKVGANKWDMWYEYLPKQSEPCSECGR